MLTREQIEDIISEKDKFSEFVSASMVLAFTKGLERTKHEKTPLSAISNFIETMRKTRADLTGDSHENQIPRMMVNIQFGSAPKAVSLPIDGEVVEPEPKKGAIKSLEKRETKVKGSSVNTDRFFGESNVSQELEDTPEPVKNVFSDDSWHAVDSGRLNLWDHGEVEADQEDESDNVSATSTDS